MTPTDSGRIGAGFNLIQIGFIDSDGFFIGASAAGPSAGGVSSMLRWYGAKTAPVAIKEPTVETATGDDGALASFQFEAAELPDGVITIGTHDLTLDALMQGTKSYELHQQRFGALQPGNDEPPSLCLILMRRAQTYGKNLKGTKAYEGLIVPSCTITPMGSEYAERAVGTYAYKINASKVATFPWGAAISSSNLGTDAVPLIPFDSDNVVSMTAYLGDGTTTVYNVPFTPINDDDRCMVFTEGVEKIVTTSWTRSGKVFTFTSGGKPALDNRGVIYYETSRVEVI